MQIDLQYIADVTARAIGIKNANEVSGGSLIRRLEGGSIPVLSQSALHAYVGAVVQIMLAVQRSSTGLALAPPIDPDVVEALRAFPVSMVDLIAPSPES